MKIILLVAFLGFVKIDFAQQNSRLTYIAIALQSAKGELTKKNFFRIEEQTGNQFAWDIISLVAYDEWNNTIYTDMFYNGYLDSTRKYYNYFETPADALQFLADNHWELVTIYKDEYAKGQEIYSRPVYYFKKEIR